MKLQLFHKHSKQPINYNNFFPYCKENFLKKIVKKVDNSVFLR